MPLSNTLATVVASCSINCSAISGLAIKILAHNCAPANSCLSPDELLHRILIQSFPVLTPRYWLWRRVLAPNDYHRVNCFPKPAPPARLLGKINHPIWLVKMNNAYDTREINTCT
ncbi:hypothetical protein HBI67_248460 [Parastagonospora nodorum]|nr:hypothetical protein HBI72_107270 [Parastagonospora nodorum]KAH5710635.1 hypothetical protein HBI20_176640 [Parastagonospora nodorum]KAH6043914.1 hypothetical protein HBI67_248460 [Parastagonospora nodorum]KAH6049868.1 hypothetical protein HBI66_247950 [Parastagonospora nodorum]